LFHVEHKRELAFAFMGIHWVPLPNARRGEGESGPRLVPTTGQKKKRRKAQRRYRIFL